MKAASIHALTLAVCATFLVGPAAGCSSGGSSSSTASVATDLPGVQARSFLSATSYRSLRVRIDFMPGRAPSPQALAFLQARLAEHLDKPDGVVVEAGRELVAPVMSVYSLGDSRQVAATNRTVFASGSEAVIYGVYLPGQCARDVQECETTLAWGLSATSFAVFKDTCDHTAAGTLAPSDLEGAVLLHECGHLLGLVGHGTPALTPHEDLAQSGHCANQGCRTMADCMGWGLSSESSGKPSSVDFCAACVADLRANGGR